MNKIAAAKEAATKAVLNPCVLPALTVMGVVVVTGGFVEKGGLAVGDGVVTFPEGVETAVLVTGGAEHSAAVEGMTLALDSSICAKLAQLMRVLFGKCTTKLRFPKNAPMPPAVEANWS